MVGQIAHEFFFRLTISTFERTRDNILRTLHQLCLHGPWCTQLLSMSASFQEGASSTPGTSGHGEDGPWDEDIDGYEDSSFERLVDLVDGLAPHLLHSFICLRQWWKDRRGEPEAHVSFARSLTWGISHKMIPQMLKYMLYRALWTGIVLFGDVEAPPLDVCKQEFDDYNRQAGVVWNNSLSFSDRQKSCQHLLAVTVPSLQWIPENVEDDDLRRFPSFIEGPLNAIFKEHYDSKEKWLSFGRTDEKAYNVQDHYALSVVRLLEGVDARCASKAWLCLRGIRGRGAPLPLLCESSISAMWEVCNDSYYKRQITLVGRHHPTVREQR